MFFNKFKAINEHLRHFLTLPNFFYIFYNDLAENYYLPAQKPTL